MTTGTEGAGYGDEVWDRLIAATAAVVACKGYADTRIADITRVAGVSSAELFGRFRSKNDLLGQALLHVADHHLLGGT